jgi:hypothetical protein
MTTIYLPNGGVARLTTVGLHRRRERSLRPRARPTDWLAQADTTIAWGRSRGEAVAQLLRMLGFTDVPHSGSNVVNFTGAGPTYH